MLCSNVFMLLESFNLPLWCLIRHPLQKRKHSPHLVIYCMCPLLCVAYTYFYKNSQLFSPSSFTSSSSFALPNKILLQLSICVCGFVVRGTFCFRPRRAYSMWRTFVFSYKHTDRVPLSALYISRLGFPLQHWRLTTHYSPYRKFPTSCPRPKVCMIPMDFTTPLLFTKGCFITSSFYQRMTQPIYNIIP
jgi:hypothetical protein